MSRPAGIAIPAGTESVLRALAGTDRPLGVREVARVAHVSANRASQVLSHLIEHGVVLADEHGAARLCRLNRAHLALEPLLALAGLRGRMLAMLRAEVASWRRPAVHASLFGSAARGDGDTRSDLDLLIVRPDGGDRDDERDDEAWERQLHESGERIAVGTGNRAAWFVTTPADLRRAVRASEPILPEWRRDAVHIGGRRLQHLLRDAAV